MFGLNFYIFSFLVVVVVATIYVSRTKKKISELKENVVNLTTAINAIRYGNLSVKTTSESPYFQELADSINRMTETFSDRERMKTEAQTELMFQNNLLRSVMNSLLEGLILVDENFNIIRATSKIEKWFGKEEKTFIGKYLFDYIIPKSKKKYKKYEDDDIKIKNSKKKFKLTINDLKVNDEEILYLCIVRDVTIEKEFQKLKEDFIAAITHDLKVPLLAQLNVLNFLIDGKFGEISEKQKKVVSGVTQSTEGLLELTRNILDGFRIDKATSINAFEKVKLLDLIEHVNEMFTPILEKEDRVLKIEVSPDIYVNVDAMNIRRVFGNLIQNAISHTEKGDEILVSSYLTNDYVVVSVKDKGIGIKNDKMDKIFEKYYTTNNKFRNLGTGLGLYVAKEIVRAHGGAIFVSSEEEEGTEFGVYLPLLK